MKVNLKDLNQYIEEGWIEYQDHPSLPLRIYNYSRNCQFEEYWDHLTLMCRGLVLDHDGNIIARPFRKFFNLEESKHTPTTDFEVYEKMDGSLGILFNYNDEWILATRGSFTSDQAIRGKKILEKYRMTLLSDKDVYQAICGVDVRDYTILGEICFKENRIVVDYGDMEDFVLLGMVNKYDGSELEHNKVMKLGDVLGVPVVKKYDGVNDYKEIKTTLYRDNAEGFVIKFSNGDRCKIKFEEYVRLHRLLTNFSNVDIWESLKNGDNIEDLLKEVPDEFDKWVRNTISSLRYSFFQISEYCGKYHDGFRYGKFNDRDPEPTRKEYAEFVQKNIKKELWSVMFRMWDKKSYDDVIWKLIRPIYSKPFWNKEN